MPRASREQVLEHREQIEAASVRLFKERGLTGVSVADVMAEVGLTHGGFYGHFKSKDQLVTTACMRAFNDSVKRWEGIIAGGGDELELMSAVAAHYLSKSQRDNPADGCPTTALALDVSREREDKPVRKEYLKGVTRLVDVLTSVTGRRQSKRVRQQALARLSMMVGALTLARAVRGDALSEEILDAAKAYLKADAKASMTPS